MARPTSSLPSFTDLRKHGAKNVMFCFDIDANSRAAFPGGENYCECLHAVPLRAEANTTNLASAGSGSDFLLYGGQKVARKKNGKGGKESVSPGSRDFVTGGCCTSEPALFCRTTPIYLPESSRPISWGRVPRPAFSRRRTTKTDCLESVSKKKEK